MTEQLHFHFSLSCIGGGNGNPLQCSCLENPRDGRAWWAAVYGVARSRTRLKQLSSSSSKILAGLPLWLSGKEPTCQCRRCGFNPDWGRSHMPQSNYARVQQLLSLCSRAQEPQLLTSVPGLGRFPWRRKWQSTPVFLPGKIPWTEEPGGLQSMRLQRVGHDLVTEQEKKNTSCQKIPSLSFLSHLWFFLAL